MTPIIDAHQHFIDTDRADYPWITETLGGLRGSHLPDVLAQILTENDVVASVAIQALNDGEETRWLLELAEQNPFVAGVVGWVDLTSRDVCSQIDALLDMPGGQFLKGIRHGAADEDDPFWLARDDVNRGLQELGRRGLTFDLEVGSRELNSAIVAAQLNPDVSFALDHLAKPHPSHVVDSRWAAQIMHLGALPNVTAKISGLVTEAEWDDWTPESFSPAVDTALEAFGPARLMFGSDWPVCELAATYRQVVDLSTYLTKGLSASEVAQVMFDTASTFYQLTPPAPGQKDRS